MRLPTAILFNGITGIVLALALVAGLNGVLAAAIKMVFPGVEFSSGIGVHDVLLPHPPVEFILTGAFYGFAVYLYFNAIESSGASSTVPLWDLSIVFVLLLELQYLEPPNLVKLLGASLLAAAGMGYTDVTVRPELLGEESSDEDDEGKKDERETGDVETDAGGVPLLGWVPLGTRLMVFATFFYALFTILNKLATTEHVTSVPLVGAEFIGREYCLFKAEMLYMTNRRSLSGI